MPREHKLIQVVINKYWKGLNLIDLNEITIARGGVECHLNPVCCVTSRPAIYSCGGEEDTTCISGQTFKRNSAEQHYFLGTGAG